MIPFPRRVCHCSICIFPAGSALPLRGGDLWCGTNKHPDKCVDISRIGSQEYKFNTGKPELMEIQAGQLNYCLSGETQWHDVKGGESFHVPGNSYFELKVTQVTDYICSFLEIKR